MKFTTYVRNVMLVLSVAGLTVMADKPTAPPDANDILGAWVGFDQSVLTFCRLELEPNGLGVCCISHGDELPVLYKIQRWSLTGSEMNVDLASLDQGAEPAFLKGAAGHSALALELGSLGAQWRTKISLVTEREFTSRNDKAKQRIGAYRRTR